MESFFGTLKSEFFYLKRFESIEELTTGLDEYIRYYNHDRIKLRLNGLSPVDYRPKLLAKTVQLFGAVHKCGSWLASDARAGGARS
uniref:IS3 family transposase n=1 Tax=Pseudomonas bharatica TaxID=2692112 RepID=UPI001F043CAF|nr:IS3 family transposase [Pseudomonas bharatica]